MVAFDRMNDNNLPSMGGSIGDKFIYVKRKKDAKYASYRDRNDGRPGLRLVEPTPESATFLEDAVAAPIFRKRKP